MSNSGKMKKEIEGNRAMLIGLFFLLNLCNADCFTHWKVTESGRIEAKDDSMFTLQRPYDLAAFLKQDERVQRLEYIKKLLTAKDVLTKHGSKTTSVQHYQENFYKNDADCIKAGKPLTKFSFYETHLIPWKDELEKFPDWNFNIKKADLKNEKNLNKKPYCSVDLPFSLGTFDHLETVQQKETLTMQPDLDLLLRLQIDSEDIYGLMVTKALDNNSSSWLYMTMASDYFRVRGDYLNAIKCLQRAIYYSPKQFKNIPTLALSNMLHKLNYINDSLAIALSALSFESNNSLMFYYIGNIYVTLGELNSSVIWYEKALQLEPSFTEAVLKKHAIFCHQKLEKYLEDQHEQLQSKLDELKDYQSLSDEFLLLTSKIDLEKSSSQRKAYTKKIYEDFIKNSKSVICDWNARSKTANKLKCKNVSVHYSVHFSKNETKSPFIKTMNKNTYPFEYHIFDTSDSESHDHDHAASDADNSEFKNLLNEKSIKNKIHISNDLNFKQENKQLFPNVVL